MIFFRIVDTINIRKTNNIKLIRYTRKTANNRQEGGVRMAEMSNAAREAKNAYRRAWYSRNKEKQKEYNKKYWEKKAKEAAREKNEDATE